MNRRLVLSYLTLATLVLLLLEIPLGVVFARGERRQLELEVKHDALSLALLVEDALESGQTSSLAPLVRDYTVRVGARVVVVDAQGRAVADSSPSPDEDPNFANRPEIVAALAGKEAVGRRYSKTAGTDLIFVAEPVAVNGHVIGATRITFPMSAVQARIRRTWLVLAATGALILAATWLVSALLARSVTRPIRDLADVARRLGEGDLSARAKHRGTVPEFGLLAAVLNDTAAQIAELLAGQRAFVADASHQLRTPLAALRLRLENVRTGDAGAERDVAAALEEVGRLSRLVDGLLAMARVEGARAVVEPVDIAAAVRERAAAWDAFAAERDVRLDVSAPSTFRALSGPGRVEQILDNLLANALDVAPSGSTISLDVAAVDGWCEVRVTDHGPGLGPEDRTRAFDRFWRGAQARAGTGSGLGLAIVRQLLRSDGGEVELTAAAEGTGVTAVVRLRAAPH